MIEMPAPCVHCGEIYDLNDLWPDWDTPTDQGYAVQCKDCKRSREQAATPAPDTEEDNR